MHFDEYAAHDAVGLAELVRTRQASARELVEAAIARIEAVNPKVHAVIHPMFEQARRAADAPLVDGAPFAGVPFLIKDLLTTFAGEVMENCCAFYRGYRAPHDSELMRRYRAAGVIVLGKTNTPELGLAPFTEPRAKGITRNPWNLAHGAGGSSGGSAAAVASGMVPMAGGGDGGGSIRIPASACGVFGMKPSRGRVPTGPDFGEIWGGAVSEGVLSRSVRDTATMLDAVQGSDVGAPYVIAPPARPFAQEVDTDPGPLRIAFSTGRGLGHGIHPDCRTAVLDAVSLLESLGHHVEEKEPALDATRFNNAFLTLVCGDVAADVEDARELTGRTPTRADFEVATWGLATLGNGVSAGEYAAARRYLQRVGRTVGAFFESYDLFLTPTLGAPPAPHGSLQPRPQEEVMLKLFGAIGSGGLMKRLGAIEQAAAGIFDYIPWPPLFNITGQPAMSVPLHWNAAGLPIGVQLAGRMNDEATLFRIAGQLERSRPWRERRPPL